MYDFFVKMFLFSFDPLIRLPPIRGSPYRLQIPRRFPPFQVLIADINHRAGKYSHQKSADHIRREMHTQIQSGQRDQSCQYDKRNPILFRQHAAIDECTGKGSAGVAGWKGCFYRNPAKWKDGIRIMIGPHAVHQRFQGHICDQKAEYE